MADSRFSEQLKALPTKPGVYLMKDDAGKILYVGKAINLHNRVRSYFGSLVGLSSKIRQLVARIADFEYIVTASELEALLLECNLIKKHRPRYNSLLKDDKNFPYIKVSLEEDWPRVYVVRRQEADGARYFGPFTDSRSVWTTLDVVKKLFPYRSCTKEITGTDPRPCLDFHIKRCVGPCIGAVTRQEYREVIDQVMLFLEGKHEAVVRDLRAKMDAASESLEYERAAFIRDQVRAIEKIGERQRVVNTAQTEQDVIAFARDNGQACVQVFLIRAGKIVGRESFVMEGTQDEEGAAILTSFLKQFYDVATYVPPQILLPSHIDEMKIIQDWLRQKRGDRVALRVPRQGDRKQLIELVEENAREALDQLRVKWLADERKTTGAVEELQAQLRLPKLPERIECFDISNIQGTSAVGSMVVFEHGKPAKAHYRRFQIKTVKGPDDFAMMEEVLRRRFGRAARQRRPVAPAGGAEPASDDGPGESAWGLLPDLLMVDGGRGQLNIALKVLEELEFDFVPTVALAKEHEELYLPDSPTPLLLPRGSQGLFLVQQVRDEAHRFALGYHRKLRGKRSLHSSLDDVPGIGPKRKIALIRRFGSTQGVRDASVDEIAAVPGMTRSSARRLKEYL